MKLKIQTVVHPAPADQMRNKNRGIPTVLSASGTNRNLEHRVCLQMSLVEREFEGSSTHARILIVPMADTMSTLSDISDGQSRRLWAIMMRDYGGRLWPP